MSTEEQFLQFADVRPDALLLVSGSGTVLAANRAAGPRLGLAPADLRGRPLADFTAEPAAAVAAYLRSCTRSRELVLGALTVVRPDGSRLPCRGEGALYRPRDEGADALVLLGLVPRAESSSRFVALTQQIDALSREVARRRRVERELLAQREWLEVTLASIGDAVIATDTAGRVVFLNPTAADLTGWRPEEALRQPVEAVFAIVNEETREPAENPVTRVLREGVVVGLANHTVLVGRDGTPRPVEDSAAPIRDGDRRVVGTVLVFHDVSERRRMERELRRRADEVAEADRGKDAFLTMLAHELRNPLAPVLNSVQLLMQAPDDAQARRQALETLGRQARHMTRLVDGLLEATRLVRGRVELQRERLDLGRVVRATAEDRRPMLEQAGLALAVEAPETPVWVLGDATRLAQVLDNLLDNAARFTDAGGRVVVRLAVQGEQVVLTVADTGEGIAAELLPRLFTVFAQGDRSLDRARGGLGLGLFVVKALVEMHGGRVQASSAGPGRGAEFALRLPGEPEPPALAAPAAGAVRARRAARILLIEDNRDAADSLRLLLQVLGYEVRVAYTGPEGVKAAAWAPEVVISDIGLPGLDGYAVAAALRHDPASAGAVLIGLSGYGAEEDLRRAREAGFDHYLVKPAPPEQLERLLASLALPREESPAGKGGS